jgi:hypothetical protein
MNWIEWTKFNERKNPRKMLVNEIEWTIFSEKIDKIEVKEMSWMNESKKIHEQKLIKKTITEWNRLRRI